MKYINTIYCALEYFFHGVRKCSSPKTIVILHFLELILQKKKKTNIKSHTQRTSVDQYQKSITKIIVIFDY